MLKKPFLLIFCTVLCTALLCACSVKNKNALVSYAKQNFGACKFIKQETTGSGIDEEHTIWLVDKDTGIEYTVTSKLDVISIDGSTFGYSESTSTNFRDLYWTYVINNARDEINAATAEFNIDSDKLPNIVFNDRPDPSQPEAAARKICEIIKKYDKKNLFDDLTSLVYADNENIYLGVYETKSDEWLGNDAYLIIDLVQEKFPGTEYSSSIYGCLESYVDRNDIDKLVSLGAVNNNTFDIEFFFFRDPEHNTIIAFNMSDIGLNGVFVGTYENYGAGRTLYCEALDIT